MNIPATEIHNPFAPWNESDLHFDEIVELKKEAKTKIHTLEYNLEVAKEENEPQEKIDLLNEELDKLYHFINH